MNINKLRLAIFCIFLLSLATFLFFLPELAQKQEITISSFISDALAGFVLFAFFVSMSYFFKTKEIKSYRKSVEVNKKEAPKKFFESDPYVQVEMLDGADRLTKKTIRETIREEFERLKNSSLEKAH